jgi:CRP-like cAMP-binding protein
MEAAKANGLWAAMTEEDKAVLGRRAVLSHLPKDDILLRRGEAVDRVFLPIDSDISNVIPLADGMLSMASNVGREGVTGLAAFMADEPIGWDLLVAVGGSALAIPTPAFRERVDASPHLHRLLLSLTHYNQIEAAQNAVCNSLHSVTARVVRWLLMTQDRTGQHEYDLKQEDLAQLLGAQRTTINSVIRALADSRAVQSRRSRLQILNREALIRQTCECYEAIGSTRWRRAH